MNRVNYNMKEHGFVGHLSIPEQSTKYGVIVIMGGEQSILPGTLMLYAVPCGKDVIYIDGFRTLGPDEGVELSIDAAFEKIMQTLVLK